MISHPHDPLHLSFMQTPFLSCPKTWPQKLPGQVDGFVVGLHNLYNFANLLVTWLHGTGFAASSSTERCFFVF